MSSKRQATSNLNHENWDKEEEPEERGTFRTATKEELNLRVIKKARRKVAGKDDAPAESTNVFSGFSGFGKPATTSSPYAFLAKLPTSTTEVGTSSTPTSTFSFLSGETAKQKDEPKTTPTPTFSFGAKKEATSTTSIFGKKDNEPGKLIYNPPSTSMFKPSVPAENSLAIAKPTKTIQLSSEYRESVANLNRGITKFIKDNVNENPYCILTPVFDNYNKHLKELKDEEAERSAKTISSSPSSSSSEATVSMPAAGYSFGKPSIPIIGSSGSPPSILFGKKPNCTITSGTSTTTATKPMFSFGLTQAVTSTTSTAIGNTTTTPAAGSSIFSFSSSTSSSTANADASKPGFFSQSTGNADSSKPGFFSQSTANAEPTKPGFFSQSTTSADATRPGFFSLPGRDDVAPKTNGFSIGDNKPSTSGGFSFGKPSEASQSTAASADNEDEDTPPKVEFKQVVEDDAVYSKRCKVFVKKDEGFTDRGVGTLYLKPVKDSEKTQLIVRADTNLGNILVNLILSDGLPTQRSGKNNVMMVCLPTPEEKKATTLLLRVKTADDADELLDQIKKHIK